MHHNYYVYIITNKYNTVIYTGVTNNLMRRISEHKQKLIKGFSAKYNCNKLVFYEYYFRIDEAIKREKQIKGWKRNKKIDLIESMNPDWNDLYEA